MEGEGSFELMSFLVEEQTPVIIFYFIRTHYFKNVVIHSMIHELTCILYCFLIARLMINVYYFSERQCFILTYDIELLSILFDLLRIGLLTIFQSFCCFFNLEKYYCI